MFYRQGGSTKAINRQYDSVYVDTVGMATGWLPVARGNVVAINIARASINFQNAALSVVTKSGVAPNAEVWLEQKHIGGQNNDAEAFPLDRWQNVLVASSRRINADGWVRLRLVNFNPLDGSGLAMALQVNRTGDNGADV